MLKNVILILTIFIILSGCVEESDVNKLNESIHQGPVNTIPENMSSITQSREENIPEVIIFSIKTLKIDE